MNAALTQFLVDVTRGHRKAEFIADRDAVLGASSLQPELRDAIRTADLGTLWLAGAHPMALMYFARSLGWDNPRYYACLEAAELTRVAADRPAPPVESGPPRTHRSNSPHAP